MVLSNNYFLLTSSNFSKKETSAKNVFSWNKRDTVISVWWYNNFWWRILGLMGELPFQEPWFSAQFVCKIWSWKHWRNRMFGRVQSPKTRHPCASVLQLPMNIRCPQRTICDRIEGLCMLLRRFSYPCRYSDMITSSRVMHDYERSHGQHFQQSRPQNLWMEWRCFESSFVTGVCWCYTCKRRPTRKLFWIHRWDSETDSSSWSTAKNCV